MNLKDKINAKQRAAVNQSNEAIEVNNTPSLEEHTNKPTNNKNTAHKILIAGLIILTVFILFLYMPQIFIDDESASDATLTNWDASALAARQRYISDNPYKDFDNDGIINSRELSLGTNVYSPDTDRDGVNDIDDNEPKKYGEQLYDALASQGLEATSAFQMNDVVLWAENKQSFIQGGVTKTLSGGYHFKDFNGWAKFPSEGKAYKYKDGIHTLLEYKEHEKAWYIDEECDVYIIQEEPELVYQVRIFGSKSYKKGFMGKLLNFMLPEKGFITCKKMWLEDTFINIEKTRATDKRSFAGNEFSLDRFARNSNTLKDLISVYYSIDDNVPVLASIVDDEKGETIIIIYGYTMDGDLLISSIDGSTTSVLNISPIATKSLTKDGIITSRECFEFNGAGFSSSDGQTISFFASAIEPATSDEEIIDVSSSDAPSDETESSEEPAIADPIIMNPMNGEQTVDGKTFYYIDGKQVTSAFIRKNEETGNLQVVALPVSKAFYVDANGIKDTGVVNIGEHTYLHTDEGFLKNTFAIINGDAFELSKPGNKGVKYCGNSYNIVTGWFTHESVKYYASEDSSEVLYNCFVRDENDALKFLDHKGTICTNKLLTIDGVEIMLDQSGNIINYQQAKATVDKYTRK